MSQSAAPRPGDVYLKFDGQKDYVEIPSSAANTVSQKGLTVSAWMRPDTLNFPHVEGTGYIYWLGKGDKEQDRDQQEWTFRMYNHDCIQEPRPNRISFYVFNPQGGLGVGGHYDRGAVAGEWLHVAGVIDSATIHIYVNGAAGTCFQYIPSKHCEVQRIPGTQQQLVIHPQPGHAPLRLATRDFHSFLHGGLTRVRIWKRALVAQDVRKLFESDTVPQDMAAEYLLNADTGTRAIDTVSGNNGAIHGAAWATQE